MVSGVGTGWGARSNAHPPLLTDLDCISAITAWCECLQGKQPLLSALRQVAKALGARSICLSRHSRDPIRMAQTVAFSRPEVVTSSADLERSFAHCVLGPYIDRPRVGSVWLSSLMDEHNDPALLTFQKRMGVAETVVVPLALEEKRVDYLEMHFASLLDAQSQLALETIADSMSRLWVTRSPGLYTEAILANRKEHCVAPGPRHLLSTANPAGLSRAEFRVCLLLSRGLNRTGICKELSVSPATLRTHLRSIFRKTGVSSLPELVYALLTPPGPPQDSRSVTMARMG